MRFRFASLIAARSTVAEVVETAVATFTAVLVTVFFVTIMLFPDAAFAQAANSVAPFAIATVTTA